MASHKLIVTVVMLALLVGGGLVGAFVLLPHQKYQCGPQSMVQTSKLTPVNFDAVTKYQLPQNRSPNAVTVAPDGSVWFGELDVPGVAHLYPGNDTLVEYRWPFSYPSPSSSTGAPGCFDWSNTWGVAIWNGMVWATYQDNNTLVGLDPSNDTFETLQLNSGSLPYTLAVGPDNGLWFTELSSPARIGRVAPATHQISYYTVPSGANSTSAYLLFRNSTLGYVLSIYPYSGGGNIFSFNPSASDPSFELVGGNETAVRDASALAPSSVGVGAGLSTPTSIALGEGGIWLTEHSGSDMAFYDESMKQWNLYPTSTVGYISWTLPYFDVSNGSVVWFNEHYGNRLGEICCNNSELTEYSFSDPPARNGSAIGNALTIAQAGGRVWFTEWTGDYVGFVDTSYKPSFSTSLNSSSTVEAQRGATISVRLELSGESSKNLTLQFSDSEQASALPKNLSFTSSIKGLASLDRTQPVAVTISVGEDTPPRQYTALSTVTDGLVSRSVYFTVIVLG